MVFIIIGTLAFILLVLSIIYGAVYVPSIDWAVEEMLDLAQVKKGEKAVDLGAGNGKILIALAKRGVEAHGYEINPFLVMWSYVLIWRSGVWGKAHPHFGSFFNVNISDYDVITIFVVPYIMKAVERKVFSQAKKNARIVVESFPFPTKKPVKKTRSIYLYKIS